MRYQTVAWASWQLLALSACSSASEPSLSSARPQLAVLKEPLHIAIVSELQGELEPCGCTRTASGGVDKLAHAINQLRRSDTPLLVLGVGNLFRAAAPSDSSSGVVLAERKAQSRLKADTMLAVLSTLGMQVLAPGAADREAATRQLESLSQGPGPKLLGSAARDAEGIVWNRSIVQQVGGYQVALFSLAAPPAADELKRLRAGADLLIAISPVADSGELHLKRAAEAGSDLLVSAGEQGVYTRLEHGLLSIAPAPRAEQLTVLTVRPRTKGARAWQIVSGREPQEPGEAHAEQRVLDGSAPSDPEARKLLSQLFARLNSRARQLTSEPTEPAQASVGFVGSRTCAACHTPAYVWWQQTGHGHAYRTLVRRGRELDLDCIGCHVTGFEQPGGSTLGALSELHHVGCESCHGAGSRHVDNPNVRSGNVRRGVPQATCLACHDPGHSEGFAYTARRAALLVPAHGKSR